ncbi:MAG: CotH kinase family protein [Chitinophagales bacterium]
MRKIPILIFLQFILTGAFSQVFTDSNLPIVVINTIGQPIHDDTKINCDMGIIYNGPGIRNYLTDPYNNYNGKIGIELRGSTSQQYPKKSYGVETRDSSFLKLNVSLLGMPEENDWILYGAYPDKTLMRNEITFDLFSKMQPWSPRFVYCELTINGDYKGVYSLLERIKRDENRIDIATLDSNDIAGDSLTGGYIIKIDKLTGNSLSTWTSPYQDKLLYLFHDPEDIELTIEQQNYIEDYVTDFEDAVYGPDFSDSTTGFRAFVDVRTFADFFIMQELGRTVDGYRSSSFMYKDKWSNGGKLKCGPMWDFNLSYGNADYCSAYDTTGWQYNFADICWDFPTEPPNWWPRMLEDTAYANFVKCRWIIYRNGILNTDTINNWIDSIALYLDESKERNFERWDIIGEYVNWNYFIGDSYEEEIDYLKWWFKARSEWLDANLPGNCNMDDYLATDGKPVLITVGIDDLEIVSSNIFPNPFSTVATFVFNSTHHTERTLFIYNVLGGLVKQIIIPQGSNTATITWDQLSNGIYFYELKENSVMVSSGRMMLSN